MTFGITIEPTAPIHFVHLTTQPLLLSKYYPIFTLAGQALGSIIVGVEAVLRFPTDIFIDTTGFAFLMPLTKCLTWCKTAVYVHYPIISSDMLSRVTSVLKKEKSQFVTSYNNADWIRRSTIFSMIKVAYYFIFYLAYKFVGSPYFIDLTLTNSSWTNRHIKLLWGGSPKVLYPPCPIEDLYTSALSSKSRRPWILSVGQFRPEKNHELQIKSFHLFLKRQNHYSQKDPIKLILIGGCRNADDYSRVEKLKEYASSLNLTDSVEFHLNISYTELKGYYSRCLINLHTMTDEHFGIGIVEGMASGLITVAHNSGGPLMDIIGPKKYDLSDSSADIGVGFLASTAEEYSNIFEAIFLLTPNTLESIREAAKSWITEKFSMECFSSGWLKQMNAIKID